MEAIALLHLAISLLIAASGPNIPPELRDEAVETARFAIEYANAHPDTVSVSSVAPAPVLAPQVIPPLESPIILTVGGKTENIVAAPNRTCQGREAGTSSPCWHTDVTWKTSGFAAYSCGFTDGPSWGSGYWGLSGSKESDFLEGTTTFRLQCKNDSGSFFSEVVVNVI